MPSRILLVSTNRCTTPERVFPLGLTFLQAALRRAGHECHWLDLLDQADQLDQVLQEFRPEFVAISLRNIDDVVIGKQETFFEMLPSVCEAIRHRTSCRIIVGGSGFSIFPAQLLEFSGADFGIAGEGEHSLPLLLKRLEAGDSCEDIPGLVYRKQNRVVLNPPQSQPFESEVGETDRPAAIAGRYLSSNGVLNVQTQRGCSYRCCYCTYPVVEGRKHRRRPAELVAEEFAQLERLNTKYAFIVDSVFNSSSRHVEEVCEAILRRGLKISWGCFLRPQGLTAELMRLMARAGLAHVEFGSDSFCDEVLEAYQKGFTFEDIRYATELAHQ
ncbi:MAG TPA: cobalamin-dependent protein, partial [Candidatus Sulfotelmatobacter sp.]|nr:cobalamin-dependent protein [Candidatus Sulfotelmatobacter sp.]